MAQAAKRRVVINTARRKNLSAKQIKYFGTPAQKAALKRHRAASRHSVKKTVNRSRSFAKHPHRKVKNVGGEILSLVLNPGGRKGNNMAAPRRRKSSRSSGRRHRRRSTQPNTHHRRRASRPNPGGTHRRRARRPNAHHRRRRGNPGRATGGGITQNAIFLLAGATGFFGSKVLTQAVMGANNTGFQGYLGNALATAGLALVAYMFKMKKAAAAVVAGGVLQIAARAVTDNTPFGKFTAALGVGDYQMQSFVTPQRLKDPLGSAEIEIPPGWAPTTVISSAAPPAGMHGFNRTGGGLYSGGGLYAS